MAFKNTVTESQFSDFFAHTREELSDHVTNIVTPEHMIFQIMEKMGAVVRKEPGRPLREDLLVETTDRTTVLSRSNRFKARNLQPHEGMTSAEYHWLMLICDLVIDEYEYRTCTDTTAMGTLIKARMEMLDIDVNEKLIDWLWNGYREGSEYIPGLKHIIQFDPTVDPTIGLIGGISGVTDLPAWKNNAKNFNAAAASFTGGAQTTTFLADTNGWGDMWRACTNNPDAQSKRGQPHVIAINEPMVKLMETMVEVKKIYKDDTQSRAMGQDVYGYKTAKVAYDRDVPDDPNDSSYGVAFFINCMVTKWVFGKGMEKDWSPLTKMGGHTGWQADRTTMVNQTCAARNRNGVVFGVKAITAS